MTDTTPRAEIPAYLTAQETARLLRVRQAKVIRWLRSGELAGADLSERPGRGRARWRISKEAIEQFLRARQPAPPAKRAARRRTKQERPAGWIEFIK
ncbi:MAG: helix-turn-helix domain-containing protein [Pirellulaceae bacterium]|nr:helix-turn-helix domain-containing protein [Pirellulaceae bacterium]